MEYQSDEGTAGGKRKGGEEREAREAREEGGGRGGMGRQGEAGEAGEAGGGRGRGVMPHLPRPRVKLT